MHAHRGNPITCLKLHNRTIHLLLFIAFAVALILIVLFIFNLIFRSSLFIRFSSPLQCHFECFSVQRISSCDASFNRKMSPPRSVIRQVTGHVDSFRLTCRRCQREIRERLETMIGRNGVWCLIGKIYRESITRRWKALFRDCYCRDVII